MIHRKARRGWVVRRQESGKGGVRRERFRQEVVSTRRAVLLLDEPRDRVQLDVRAPLVDSPDLGIAPVLFDARLQSAK